MSIFYWPKESKSNHLNRDAKLEMKLNISISKLQIYSMLLIIMISIITSTEVWFLYKVILKEKHYTITK